MLTEYEIAIRLVIAAALGSVIGLERERHDQPAGLRTHIILVLGATIAMCISINLSIQFRPLGSNGDPERIAAQVISGIGFLGAGAIFRLGAGVKGLTTAASLWTTAIIGLAIGAGYIIIGVVATLSVLFALAGLDLLEKKVFHSRSTRSITVRGVDRPGYVDELKTVLSQFGISIKSISLSKDLATNRIEVESLAKVFRDQDLDNMVGTLTKIEGVSGFTVK
jgi:putative Mg2+ transporter-C (MgtC) family protein